jgi:long-chain fatty acid transport protein
MGKRRSCPFSTGISLVVSLLCVCPSLQERAWPYTLAETQGIGARAIAMGGAFTAVADDGAALYYNPAGMVQVEGHRSHMEYVFVFPRVYLQRGTAEKQIYLDKPIKAPMLGIVLDISRHWSTSKKIRFGFISYFPDNFKAAARMRYGSFYDPYYPLYGDSTANQMLSSWINGAIEIFPWLSIGGGFTFGTNGSFVNLQPGLDPSTMKSVQERSKVTWQMTTEIEPMYGILIKPLERLRIGCVFRKGIKVHFNNGIQVSPSIVRDSTIVPFPIPIRVFINSHYRPLQYAVGISYRATHALLLAFDLTYYDWRQYKDESERPLNPPMKDIVAPRVGVEYFPAKDVAVRAGYGYRPSPLDQQHGTWVNYLDNDVHVFSFGAGYFWNPRGIFARPAEFSFFYQLSYLQPRTFDNVHQGQTSLRSSGYMQSVGVSVGLSF